MTPAISRCLASLTTRGQYPAGIESRCFICLALTSGRPMASRKGTTPPKAAMTSENDCMHEPIHDVSLAVNTARIEKASTIRIIMADEDRDDIIQARAQRLRDYRLAAKIPSASAAARLFRIKDAGYRHHENGTRPIGDDDADFYAAKLSRPGLRITGKDIMYGPSDVASDPAEHGMIQVAVMGKVGAGGDIEPEYEQVPPDGLHQIELPIAVPEDIIAFEVEGDSMLPIYHDGDVILVRRETSRALESFYGVEAIVRTTDGHRYIKTIQYGKTRSVVNLQSFNAKMIEGVRLEWIGEIYLKIPADQVHRISKAAKTRSRGEQRGARK